MNENIYTTNNQANITGTIEGEFKFSHELYSEKFYIFTVNIPRLSGAHDYINVIISERLLIDQSFNPGDKVTVTGQFRSYNSMDNGDNRLVLNVFAKDIELCTEEVNHNPNSLYLNGYVCKPPVYRTTPFGREITDLLLAVNRSYNKSDYIPVIAWGRNARFAKTLSVGDNVQIYGRIQSRTYQKHISEDEVITKTAYEVSVNRLETASTNLDAENDEIIESDENTAVDIVSQSLDEPVVSQEPDDIE